MTSDKAPFEPTLFDVPLHGESSSEASEELSLDVEQAPADSREEAGIDYAPLLPFRDDKAPEPQEIGTQSASAPAPPDTPKTSATPTDLTPESTSEAAEQPQQSLLTRRIKATLLDFVVALAACGLLVPLTSLLAIRVSSSDWIGFAAFALPFSFVWQVLPLGFWGRTPGMIWSGIIVRDRAGRGPTFWQAASRWLAFVVGVATLGLTGLLAMSGRSLGDRLSATEVTEL